MESEFSINLNKIPITSVDGLEEAIQSAGGATGNLDGGNASSTFDTVFDGGGA